MHCRRDAGKHGCVSDVVSAFRPRQGPRGFLHARIRVAMYSRGAFSEGKSVLLSGCFPKVLKRPSTCLNHDALVGVQCKCTRDSPAERDPILPGEERVVLTKEMFVLRVVGGGALGWDPFYLLWALCLQVVRTQWQKVTLMHTNREDVGERHREIRLPRPRSPIWAREVSAAFRGYFSTIAESRLDFARRVHESGFAFIASVREAAEATAVAPAVEAAEDSDEGDA